MEDPLREDNPPVSAVEEDPEETGEDELDDDDLSQEVGGSDGDESGGDEGSSRASPLHRRVHPGRVTKGGKNDGQRKRWAEGMRIITILFDVKVSMF